MFRLGGKIELEGLVSAETQGRFLYRRAKRWEKSNGNKESGFENESSGVGFNSGL